MQTAVIFEVLDNLLFDVNIVSFRILQESGGGSENVLDNVERYGLYVARQVPVEPKVMDIYARNLTGENLGMNNILFFCLVKTAFFK